MKKLIKLTLIMIAIVLSGTMVAQEGKKNEAVKAPASQNGKKKEPAKKEYKSGSAKPATTKANAGANKADTPSSEIIISENGVPTPVKKGTATAPSTNNAAQTTTPAAVGTQTTSVTPIKANE